MQVVNRGLHISAVASSAFTIDDVEVAKDTQLSYNSAVTLWKNEPATLNLFNSS